MEARNIASQIKVAKLKNKPVIIAIDGFGGAGKSTFAKNLMTALGDACVVEVDDFFIKDVKSDANKSNFDRERLRQQVLQPLRESRKAAYQKLLWESNSLSEYIAIPKVSYVIIEGVSSFHPDVADYMDFKIWLNVSGEVAKNRMITRDRALGEEHGELWDHWTDSYQAYKDLHHPETKADFTVNVKLSTENK